LCDNERRTSIRMLTARLSRRCQHRAGWDATFSAQKSVSLSALVGGDDRVRDAYLESVRVAVDQLEHYTQARIGGNHPPETTASLSLPSSSTIRPVRLMDMSRHNCTHTRSFSTSPSATQRQDMTGADRSWASRGLPRSLPQRKLLMTTQLFDNECDGSDLGVLCAVQHELVAAIDDSAQRHQRIGNCGPRLQSPATNRLPCDCSGRSAQHLPITRE